ncbi:MAG TPA: cytochrome P450, partial [Pseudonocardia sp.]
TVRRVEAIRPAIQRTVDGLIDDMLARGAPADIVTDLAFPVPTQVICELLGVPYADRGYFGERGNTCLSKEATAQEAASAGKDLYGYLDELIDRKIADPADDLVSRLAVERLRNDELTRSQVVEMARIMLVAGHETTANMIALSTLTLLRNPDQAIEIRDSTAPALIQNAVDELLRYLSVAHTGRRRLALEDVEIGGRVIRAGEGVIVANNVADRDESMYPGPHELDIHRPNARATLAFGYGIHQCIGQLLSRVELQVVHGTLWRRVPSLRLAVPFEEVRFKDDGSVYGLYALPVTWDRT